jgi:hypothetical protein
VTARTSTARATTILVVALAIPILVGVVVARADGGDSGQPLPATNTPSLSPSASASGSPTVSASPSASGSPSATSTSTAAAVALPAVGHDAKALVLSSGSSASCLGVVYVFANRTATSATEVIATYGTAFVKAGAIVSTGPTETVTTKVTLAAGQSASPKVIVCVPAGTLPAHTQLDVGLNSYAVR